MPASQPANFNLQEFTDVGQLLVGGRLYTYAYGTTAQKTAFTDPDGTVPHTYTADGAGGQYIALNARGELPTPLYLGLGAYDITLKRADGSMVWTRKAEGISLAAEDGAETVGYGQDTVAGALNALQLSGYETLRVYGGPQKNVYVTGYLSTKMPSGVAGTFVRDDSDSTSADDDGTVIVATNGKRWKRVFGGGVYVNWFGGDSSGAVSSSAAIAKAQAHLHVRFPSGNWLFDQNIVPVSGQRIVFEEGAVLIRNSAVAVTGNVPGLTPLTATADLDYGRNLVTLNAASFAAINVGDYVELKNKNADNSDYITDYVNTSTSDLNDPSKWVYQVQVAKVIAKLAGYKIRLDVAASVVFPLTGPGSISKVGAGVIEDVTIEGGVFVNGPNLINASSEGAFIDTSYLFGLTLRGITFNLNGMTGGYYGTIGRVDIDGCTFNQAARLAVFLRQNMANSKVRGCTFKAQATNDASLFLEASNYNIAITGNTFDGSLVFEMTDVAQLISAVQMDAKVRGCTITSNTVNGYGVGFRLELGCMNNTINGNTLSNIAIAGVRLNQAGQNVIGSNTFYNCGIASSPGSLADSLGAITLFDSHRNTITNNEISNDSQHVAPAFLINGDRNSILGSTLASAGSSRITGSYNRFAGNRGDTLAPTSQIVMVTGPTSHHNVIEDNELVDNVPCVYGIRIDNGSECNIVRRNRMGNVEVPVGLTDTTNAQSLCENTRYSANDSELVNIYNVAIQAPQMPKNAVMPRRFRIYSTVTTAGDHLSDAQGKICWEYVQYVANVGHRFIQLSANSSTVDLAPVAA